jgi:hypothetical protein
MKNPRAGGVHVVLFWFMNDWGKFGRAYEKIAESLSRQKEVDRVLVVMPPTRMHDALGVLRSKSGRSRRSSPCSPRTSGSSPTSTNTRGPRRR